MTEYRTIEVNGSGIFYREGGDQSAATLLLLHGFPSSSSQYDDPRPQWEHAFVSPEQSRRHQIGDPRRVDGV
jgi:pimeloyl-ACP methyl ester carboxylesterase